MIAELMGLSIWRGLALFFVVTTFGCGIFSFIQTKRIDSFREENRILTKQIIESRKNTVDLLDALKSTEPQVEILKRHEQKLLDECKNIIRNMDNEPGK